MGNLYEAGHKSGSRVAFAGPGLVRFVRFVSLVSLVSEVGEFGEQLTHSPSVAQ
jgi:hypothetical protein